jgi:hypothetical protein
MQMMNSYSFLEKVPIDSILWVVFGVTVVGFGVFSAILFWHWRLYSTGKYTTVGNMILYLSVSSGLIGTMIASLVWFSLV